MTRGDSSTSARAIAWPTPVPAASAILALARYAAVVYLIGTGVVNTLAALQQRGHGNGTRTTADLTQIPANTIACVIALWFPTLGATIGLGTLAATLVQGPTGNDSFFVLMLTPLMLASTARLRTVATFATIHVAYALFRSVGPERPTSILGWYLGLIVASYGTAIIIRRLLIAERRGRRTVAALERSNKEIGKIERARLAGELSELVADSLTVQQSLVAPGGRGQHLSPEQVWDEIGLHVQAALGELRRLVKVLRESPADEAQPSATGWRIDGTLWGLAAVGVGLIVFLDVMLSHPTAVSAAVIAITGSALLIALHRPAIGVALAALALGTNLLIDTERVGVLAVLMFLPAALALHPTWRRRTPLVAVGVLGYAALAMVRHPTPDAIVALGGASTTGLVLSMICQHFLTARESAAQRASRLRAAAAQARADEKHRLARELHDVVGHQLSIISLQVMAHGHTSDPDERRAAFDVIAQAAAAAKRDLDLVIRVLQADRPTDDPTSGILTPSTVAEALNRTLASEQHPTHFDISPQSDQLDPSVRRTLVRTMQEGATNILRYAPPGGPCHMRVDVTDGVVHLRITSPLPPTPRASKLSSGLGLRGIHERALLIGGRMEAGPRDGDWVLDLEVPIR